VYEIDELPALKVNPRGRNIGLLTERAFVIAQGYGPSDFYNRGKNKPLPGELPAQYQDNPYLCWLKAAENYARYCRFTGQNTHFMGSFQYSRLNQGVTLDSGAEGCSLVPEFREVLVNVLQANGISTYGVVEYATNFDYWSRGWPSLSQAHRGADFMFQIDDEGHTRTSYMQSENPMTSRLARAAFVSGVADVAQRFAVYPGFKGLALVVAPGWTSPAYPSDKTSFDDRTMAVFEQATSLKVPVTDKSVDRFQQRHAWIIEHARDAWLDFRSRKMAEVHRAMVRRLKSIRRDLEYFVFFEPYDRPGDPQGLGRQYDKAGKADIRGMLRNHGYDPLAFAKERSVSLGRILWSFDHPANRYRTCAARWEWARDPEAVKLFNRASEPRRAAFIRTGFSEGLILSRRQADKPLWPLAHRIGYLLPRDPFCMQRFAEVMVDSDVELLPYGFSDCHAAAGSEDRLREFVGEFVSLPRGRFQRLAGKGIDPNVHLAEAEIDGTYYLYVLNPAWWPCRVAIEVQTEDNAAVTRTRTDARVPVVDKKIQLDLPPYALLGLTGSRASLAPLAATVAVPADALARVEAMLSQLETRIRKSHPFVKVARVAWEDGKYVECYDRMTRWIVFRSAFRDWQWPKVDHEDVGADRE